MGAAAYNRGSKHIRDEIAREGKKRQPEADRAATYENTLRQNERLLNELEAARAELAEVRRALALEAAAHETTRRRSEDAAQASYQAMASLRVAYSEVSEKLFSVKPLTKYEAMLLVCDDGSFTLVHPGSGGMGVFASFQDARAWAQAHDGFIPARAEHHTFHGRYYRVGFNIWP